MNRRGFLKGMAGILAAGVAPAFIGSKILMPVKPALITPQQGLFVHQSGAWMRISAIDHLGVLHEIDPVTLYKGSSAVIELPGCTDKIVQYRMTWEQTTA